MALALASNFPESQVELVTKDINLRIKADVFGVNAKDYDPDETSFEDMYTGVREIEVDPDRIDQFYQAKALELESEEKLHENQYVILKDKSNANHSAIGKCVKGKVSPLISPSESIWGIHPRNVEQSFALDCLLNDEVSFVSLVGKAGTGKTLMAIAAGLYKTLDEGRFQKGFWSLRPIFPMGRDMGISPETLSKNSTPGCSLFLTMSNI